MSEALPDNDLPESGARLVAAGATLMRIENETMMSVAVQRPRNEKKILKAALDELEIVPEMAVRTMYSIPYKDGDRTVNVTGCSIHAARNLARRWGNCAAKTLLTTEDDDKVVLAGIFTDLETNVRFERLFTVSKWQHRKGGGAYKLANERLMQAVQAGASKAERNAILAGLPDWLAQSYYNRARTIAATEARTNLSKILEAFLTEGVSREMLERRFGNLNKLSDEQLADLRGMLNALRDGEATVESLFAQPQADAEPAKAGTVADVLKSAATVTAGTQKGDAPKAQETNAEALVGAIKVAHPVAKSAETIQKDPASGAGQIVDRIAEQESAKAKGRAPRQVDLTGVL